MKPEDLLKLCLALIDREGVTSILGRKQVSDVIEINKHIIDPHNINNSRFKNGFDISLRITEALSLSYLALYYQNQAKQDLQYVIYVDVENDFKNGSGEELYLSDGVLAVIDNKTDTPSIFSPFQQVIAQNIIGGNKTKNIQDLIIQELNKKIARRNTYNDTSGLIVSVLPSYGSKIDLGEIINKCDVEKFLPTFFLLYSDDFGTCQVMHIDKGLATKGEELDRVRQQSLIIHGKLPKNSTEK